MQNKVIVNVVHAREVSGLGEADGQRHGGIIWGRVLQAATAYDAHVRHVSENPSRRPLVATFRIGSPDDGSGVLRIGAARRPPRGVARGRWRRDGYFDLWLPVVAPSASLLKRVRRTGLADAMARRRFFAAYAREIARPPARDVVELLAAIATRTPIAVGCYCADESRCHRSRLKREIERALRRRQSEDSGRSRGARRARQAP